MRFPLPHVLRALLPILALTTWAQAVEIRVATFNVEHGLEAPGTAGHDAVRDVLTRIDADVVGLQEVQGADTDDDNGSRPSYLDSLASSLATNLGWAGHHLHITSTSGALDTVSRVAFISRFPITSFTDVASPPGSKDMARKIPAIVVDVPGTTNDPTLINVHLKCCFEDDDHFRRAVEMHRLTSHLSSSGLTSADNLIILGDFNLIGYNHTITQADFDSFAHLLPGSYSLGPDVSFPIQYYLQPGDYLTALPMVQIDSRQTTGSDNTQGSNTLDYLLATPALTTRPHATEIYNSVNDTSNSIGLPKFGSPLPFGTSGTASDHKAVFGDFELDSAPQIAIDISPITAAEDDPDGTAVLTVSLPAAPGIGESIAITLVSDDTGEASPAQASLTFTTGISSLPVDIITHPDTIVDGPQLVTFTATAPAYATAMTEMTVTDSDVPSYVLASRETPVLETFSGFDGSADPAKWIVAALPWNGSDDGSAPLAGNYAYGPDAADPALGILHNGAAATATANFTNLTGTTVTALQVSYDAEQWRSVLGGTADTWSVELLANGQPIALPDLDFTADTTLPTGALPGGASTTLSTIVTGLAIANTDPFQLRFTAIPGGGGGPASADIFLNEFHYDNDGGDTGEFVEVVVGPGYLGSLDDLSVVLYNGSTGASYANESLDSFTLGATTASGHRIYSKDIAGIQNGAPDGIAIVSAGNVLAFHSYEGSFVAGDGPAKDMTSTDVGVSQSPNEPIGKNSIGLEGSGDSAAAFTWMQFSDNHTKGAPNDGQTFTNPIAPQGIAIDNLSVTALLDTDQDGDPDLTDPDDDNDSLPDTVEATLGTDPLLADSDGNGTDDGNEDADGDSHSNAAEVLVTLTDPLDPGSHFAVATAPDPNNASSVLLTFPSLTGRSYVVQRSTDLATWTPVDTHPGNDTTLIISAPVEPGSVNSFFRLQVSLAMP